MVITFTVWSKPHFSMLFNKHITPKTLKMITFLGWVKNPLFAYTPKTHFLPLPPKCHFSRVRNTPPRVPPKTHFCTTPQDTPTHPISHHPATPPQGCTYPPYTQISPPHIPPKTPKSAYFCVHSVSTFWPNSAPLLCPFCATPHTAYMSKISRSVKKWSLFVMFFFHYFVHFFS